MSSRLSHNVKMSSEHARTFRKLFVCQYYMNEKKFRKNFSQNSSGQQNVTFSNFGSKSGPKNFSKKKLFFLAMFKNEITLLKFFFLKIFDFFLKNIFIKMVIIFFSNRVFS